MASALADVIVAVHLAFVLFVLLGEALILVGWARGWSWVRRFSFRLTHVAAILWVAIQAMLGETCPLTVWEDDLRRRAGQEGNEGSFIGRWMHELLFVEAPQWILDTINVAFAVLVVLTWIGCRPRRRAPVDGAGSPANGDRAPGDPEATIAREEPPPA